MWAKVEKNTKRKWKSAELFADERCSEAILACASPVPYYSTISAFPTQPDAGSREQAEARRTPERCDRDVYPVSGLHRDTFN